MSDYTDLREQYDRFMAKKRHNLYHKLIELGQSPQQAAAVVDTTVLTFYQWRKLHDLGDPDV